MKIKEIIDALEIFAPLPLQDGFDNAGLQVGLTDVEATGALLCLDVTEDVVEEAINQGINLIISHHPLMFRGYKSITGKDYTERCIMTAIKNEIAIYSMHTNLDNAPNGVNYKIAEKIGLTNVRVIDPKEYMTQDVEENVKAEDIKGMPKWLTAGAGAIGELEEPMTETEFLKHVKKTFEAGCVKHTRLTGRLIQKVAVCGGAGAFLMEKAVKEHADAFVTGEIKYHDYFYYEDSILATEIGHYESEQFTKEILRDVLNRKFPTLRTEITRINTNPIKYL
ncbi:Nif3-like dinuclear metal center hexameric protein [Bacteroides caecigallinarum]|uniref:Nif3-like dinuclear metal center hexameric protein n=1 Tax=Bacteroides caecigallinarum TaxID=1411144 RepID=UPI001F018749|nr:Nif3-like dinuclear metal center hexameric protein [Bacteroides caecigallinarum]MCF2593459.1 Nif3-like dinuclear metal center hexameric protein [Bacteroides caecigallinarum]